MNALKPMPDIAEAPDRAGAVPIDRDTALPGEIRNSRPHAGARRFALAALLLRTRPKRTCDHSAAEHGYELSSTDADCHLTRPQIRSCPLQCKAG